MKHIICIGDKYTSVEDTVTVIGVVEIKTKAGNFTAMRIKRERTLNPNLRRLEFLYLVENISKNITFGKVNLAR